MTDHAQARINQSYGRRIIRSAFLGWGARLGLAWVIILSFVAAFAPILANSMPLIASKGGEIIFPISQNVTIFTILSNRL